MNTPEQPSRVDRAKPSEEELLTALPKNKRRMEARVGIFVLLGLAATLVALFQLTDPSTWRGRYRVTTVVEDAGGIRRGDPVQMRGVNIGRVLLFRLEPEGVRITLEIEGRWDIPEDSRCRLVSGGILGGRTVEILEGTSARRVQGGGEIPGEDVPGVFDMPAELGQDAQAVLNRIQDLLAEPTVEAIQGSARELQALLGQLSTLADAQGREVARLTASLNRSAQGLEVAAGSGEDFAQAVARADSTLQVVNRTSEVVLSASEALEAILRRMEDGQGTLGQLSTNPALYETLTEALESVRRLTDDIRENPGRYVKIEIF